MSKKWLIKDGKFRISAGKWDHCDACCGCAASLIVTLAGFDGNHCTGCINAGLGKQYLNSSGFDGSYEVPFSSETSQKCTYILALANVGSAMDIEGHWNGTCTNLRVANTEDLLQIIVDVWKAPYGTGIRTIDIQSQATTPTTTQESSDVFAIGVASGPYAFGVPLANQQLCPAPQNDPGTGYTHAFYSSHGTGTVQVDAA